MKDFDLSKLDPSKFDPSKIDLDPSKPLTWAFAAATLITLLLLATIVVAAVRLIHSSLERRGQRKAMERSAARNLARQDEPVSLVAASSNLRLSDPDEAKPWPLEPFSS